MTLVEVMHCLININKKGNRLKARKVVNEAEISAELKGRNISASQLKGEKFLGYLNN